MYVEKLKLTLDIMSFDYFQVDIIGPRRVLKHGN